MFGKNEKKEPKKIVRDASFEVEGELSDAELEQVTGGEQSAKMGASYADGEAREEKMKMGGG